ncbi:replication-relaxation family protein [Plantactinospora sp. GCM10030261]|uniref:replication-relaxation family protein n=1 Tax=Plantactinospora sp. GCM10030261 TaxID=3273420 RepID=UPI00361A2E13
MDDPVLRVQSQLTRRDRVLLGWLYDHGVLTSFQIAHALFPSLDFCQRRLRTLYRLRLVARFRPQRADGGSYPYHYVIDQLGAEVVAAARDERPPRRDHARVERRRWTSTRSLAHRLGVNGFFTDLAGYARTGVGAGLVEWLPEAACQHAGTFTSGQDPLVWAYRPRVRPDGYGRWVEDGVEVPFFIEYDTGAEQLSVLAGKVAGYRELFGTIGRVWPVLFWLHSAARERNLRRVLADTAPPLPFATGARDHAATAGLSPAGAVWAIAGGAGQRLRLADLAGYVLDVRPRAGEAA